MNAMRMAAAAAMLLALGACATTKGPDKVVKAPATCTDQQVQIYFEPDSAEVTAEGRAVINQAAAGAKHCHIKAVDVLGLADAAGAPDANFELSTKRAQSVGQALAAAGLPAAEFKMAAAGDVGSVAADGTPRPLRRRADVILRLTPH